MTNPPNSGEHKPNDYENKIDYIKKVAASIQLAPFTPKSGVKIITDEKVTKAPEAALSDEDDVKMEKILATLPDPGAVRQAYIRFFFFETSLGFNFAISRSSTNSTRLTSRRTMTPISTLTLSPLLRTCEQLLTKLSQLIALNPS